MYFAIRISKDWVELRSNPTPIRGIKTSLAKTLPITKVKLVQDGWSIEPGTNNPWYPEGVPKYMYTTVEANKKVTMTQTYWRGGKKLGVLQASCLRGVCKVPSLGCAFRITSKQFLKLTSREHQTPPQRNR